MLRSSKRNSKRSLSDSETCETEVGDFIRLHAKALRVNSAAGAATDQELCKPAELPDAESGFAAGNACADANDEVVEKPAQSFLVESPGDEVVEKTTQSFLVDRPNNEVVEKTAQSFLVDRPNDEVVEKNAQSFLVDRPNDEVVEKTAQSFLVDSHGHGNAKDLNEVTAGDTGNTNECAVRDDNDIIGGILQNESTAVEELEKIDTLELSIEDDNSDGGDVLKDNENFDKIDGFFEGETKCSFTLDDVEREEGELTPDRTALDAKEKKIMDSASIQGPKTQPKKERVAEGCFQDILNAFYNNAKEYLDHQEEKISSNVLRRVKEIVRSVEDVKNNLSKESAPDTTNSKNEQIFKNFIGRYLPKSRSPGRRRASNVNSSARLSNRRLRSVSRGKLGVHSNTRSRYRSEHRHRNGSNINRSTRYPDRSSAAIRRSMSPRRRSTRISARKSNDVAKREQVQHHSKSDSHKTSTTAAIEGKDLRPRVRKDKIQSSDGGIQVESAKRLELSGKLRSDRIGDERQRKNALAEKSTVEEGGTWQRISPGKQPQLSERREARKVRHLKKKEETERINSLVKRQMGIISHIVKKQNETPEVKDKDVLCNHRHTIVLDDNKQRSRKLRHSASQNTRGKALKDLDDMEAFLDDLRDNNKKKILSDTTACNRLSRLDKELSSLTKFFEGDKKFISRDDIDIYKYNYEDDKAKKSLNFSTRKSDAAKNSIEIRKPIERISSLTEQSSHIADQYDRRKPTVDKTIRDKDVSLGKEILRTKLRLTDRRGGLIPDVLLKNQENLRKSYSESRVSQRNPTQQEKSQASKRESKQTDRDVSDLGKIETEPFTNSSTDESSDLIQDEKEWHNKSGKLKRSNHKRLKKLASNLSSSDSEEESSSGPGEGKGRGSEISDSSIVASDRARLEIKRRKLPCSRDNKIRRNGKKSINSPPPKKLKSLTAKKAIAMVGSQRLKFLKSGLKEICTTKGGRTLVLGDKRLAGKICLKLKSGGIYLMDGVPERNVRRERIVRKRAGEMNSAGKAVNRRRGNSELSPSAKRKRLELELQEMESFLEQLRAVRKEDMEHSDLDLEPSPPHDREAKFLERIRANRKAKLMACMDRNVTDKTSAKEAKCLEAMSRRSGPGVARSRRRRRGSTSSRTEQDKDALLKKLKAETRAILSGNKSATSSSRIRKTDLNEEEDLRDMESFLTTLRASSSESGRNKRSSTSKSFNVSFEIKNSKPLSRSGEPGARPAVREPKVVSKMAQNILNVLRFKNRTKQSAKDPVPNESNA